jgi:CheY-like chemotaxis protein
MTADRPLRVLIVDNEADRCSSTALLLKFWGFEAVLVHSSQALEAARVHAPDVVLLDLGMPVLDGLEVAQRLREQAPPNGKHPVIIAISGCRDAQNRQRCRESGIDLHFVKPFNPMLLKKAAESQCRGFLDCGTSPNFLG